MSKPVGFFLARSLLAAVLASACTPQVMPAAPTPPPSATPVPMPSPTPLAAYARIPGVYLGEFHGAKSFSGDLFESLGKGIAISAIYLNWRIAFSPGIYDSNARQNRITLVTWEYRPGISGDMAAYKDLPLQAIVDGIHDEYIHKFAVNVAKFDQPIFIRFGHEMNGDWYPWGGAKNGAGTLDGFGDALLPDGPERFVASYRHIHDLFQQAGADKVIFVWCPNAPFETMENLYGSRGPDDWNAARNYYPGDEYVDWMCFDGYNWGASGYGQSFGAVWTEFDGIFAESYQQLQQINSDKPIMIGEFASTEEGGDKAGWITDAFSAIQTSYPQIRGLVWFHISKETDWRIDSSPTSLEAYRQAIADDYWLETFPGMGD